MNHELKVEGPYSILRSKLTWIHGCRVLGWSPRRSAWVTAESAMRRLEVSRG